MSRAGGLPIVALDNMHPEDYVALSDGLLLTGGPDIHCGRYGEFYCEDSDFPYLSMSRENLELRICKLFLDAGKSVLGIGRGMQILNIVLGGTLYRDISENTNSIHTGKVDTKSPEAHITYHKININEGTKLSKILKSDELINSCHHQAIKELGENLIVSAVAPDGCIEAIEHRYLKAFGVQWHPERMRGDFSDSPYGPNTDLLFKTFVEMCIEQNFQAV